MERKFEVGDKVRVLVGVDILAIEKPITSLIGEITYVDDSITLPYRVCIEGKRRWFREDELELVEDDEIDTDAIYNEGLSAGERKAWEIMDIIVNKLTEQEVRDIFGPYCCALSDLMRGFSYEEVKEKIEKYMTEKKIEVGDEVYGDTNKLIGIITGMSPNNDYSCYVLWENGHVGEPTISGLKKTGRSFPQLVEMLNEMKGDKDKFGDK